MFAFLRSVGLGAAVALLCGCGALEPPGQQTARQASELSATLTAHLQSLPHVATASVVVRPLEHGPVLIAPATAPCDVHVAAILALANTADASATAAISQAARSQMVALIPNSCPPAIEIVPSAEPLSATYAKVGPFEVATTSKHPLQLALACLLLAIGALLMRLRRGLV